MNQHNSLQAYHQRKAIEAQIELERLRQQRYVPTPARHEPVESSPPSVGSIVATCVIGFLIGAVIAASSGNND